ncbi:MAG: c-type cytochrome, partial [bacterium]|nr:c-type cytochrome [bacterium]
MTTARFLVYALGLALLVSPTALMADGDAEAGQEVFEQCGVCHHADKADKKLGPGLKGLFEKEKMENGNPPTEENVLKVINEGGAAMPAYEELLSAEE